MTVTTTAALATLAQNAGRYGLVAVLLVAGLIALIVLMFVIQYFNLWLQANMSGAPVAFLELIGMRFRKVDPRVIVLSRIRSVKAGLDLPVTPLETHYLAGGNVTRVVNALIAADRHEIELPWDTACAIDLAGYDVLEAVRVAKEHGLQSGELSDLTFLDQIGVPRVGTAPV